jgi:hypothetical protein
METNMKLDESDIRNVAPAANAPPHGNDYTSSSSLDRIQKLQSLLKKEYSLKELCN